jgi:hypothetical protein
MTYWYIVNRQPMCPICKKHNRHDEDDDDDDDAWDPYIENALAYALWVITPSL